MTRPLLLALALLSPALAEDSPWGIALGAEWSGDYPKFNPLLHEAGVTWVRYFPEWHSMQPARGEWSFDRADASLASAKAHQIRIAGGLWYAAPWATSDGSTRKVPLKDIQDWRDYVKGMVTRYGKDVPWWEVWNEFNGSFSEGGTPAIYAELVREAYKTAKAVNPDVKVGLSVANFDTGFLDATIKAGAAGHFNYVCVHPYENLGALAEGGGERGFLSMAGSLRQMLAANGQKQDTPLWITEFGVQSTIAPDDAADRKQADMFTKGYVLALAQGFDKIFWFEARGPAYGKGTDHGILRQDWSKRPVYEAYRTLTTELGAEPGYTGWVDLDGAFGFVFGEKLVTWAPAGTPKFSLATAALIAQAKENASKPFPWGTDFAKAAAISCKLGATNGNEGIEQKSPETTAVVNDLTSTCRRAKVKEGGEGVYAYFRVDPSFVPFPTKELEITVVAKRLPTGESAGMNLTYESLNGYKGSGEWWTIPEGKDWSEHTWKVKDANFAGGWGWNFRTDAAGSGADFLIREVRVKK
ncbi:endo-1,4-beta-xylanase [Luteolibacter sp. Populi]|uniref:endo-1,4-beta-xylanase n=1 Tax=Luteolibacter sp. Populi TaxID=3230487 RepID=UPI003465F6E7